MGTKINENVWGEVPATGGALRINRTLRDLIAAGLYNPETGNFDMSISPWGIGYSNAGNFSVPWYTRTGEAASTSNNRISKIGCEDSKSYNTPFLMGYGIYGLRESYTDEYIRPMQRLYGGTTKDSNNYIISTVKYDLGDKPPSYHVSAADSVANLQPALYLDYQSIKVVATALRWINLITGSITRTVLTNASQYNSYVSAVNSMDLENIGIIAIEYEIYVKTNGTWSAISADNDYMIHNFKKFKVTDRLKQFFFSGNESDYVQVMPRNYIGAPYRDASWTSNGGRSIPMESYSYGRLASYHSFDNLFDWYNFAGKSAGRFTLGSWSFDDNDYKTEVLSIWGGTNPIREVHENDILSYSGYIRTCSVTRITRTTAPRNSTAINTMIYHEIAFLGLPFVMGWSANATTQNIGDADVCLPVFDDHMITTGNYVRGTDALELPNASWGNVFDDTMPEYDSNYDPNPGPGPGPDPNPNPLYPSTPGFSLASSGGKCYALVDGAIDTIFEEIYGRDEDSWLDLISGLSLYGADPMAAIISYKWYPWAWSFTGTAGLYLGGIRIGNSAYEVPRTDAEALHTENASFYYGREKNFINSRHSQARLWLPFYGFYALPQQKFISEKLTVDFHYNLPDEVGVWIISFDDVIYDFVECQCSIDVPLSATDYRGQKYAAISGVLSTAGNLINSVGDIAKSAVSVGIGGATAGGAASAYRVDTGESIFSTIRKQGIGALQAFDGTQKMQIGMMGSGATQAAGGVIGAGTSALGGVSQGFNDVMSTRRTLNQMKINLPYHGAASPTTFLNLPMFPFIQVYTNNTIDDYVGKHSQYKLKNGHACDKWVTASEMPSNSLCQASGIADMDTSGMELSEVEELNSILQNGFFIAIE